MNLETLKLFVEVIEKGSFAGVARSRNIAPSSVSRTIAKLEEELGVRLFQRSTRKLQTTEAGAIYYQRVAPIIDELEIAQQMVTDVSQTPIGTLRVTASSVFNSFQIVPILPEFIQRFPSLKMEIILTDSYLDLIEERIDVAVRLGKLEDSSYIVRKLRPMKFYVCASPNYLKKYGFPHNPFQIENHNCLLFPRKGHNLNWLFKERTGKITEIKISGKYLLTNSFAIKQCALSGMGLTLLPDWLVDEDIKFGNLVRLFADYDITTTDYQSGIWLLYPSRDYVPLKTQVFIDYLVEKLG